MASALSPAKLAYRQSPEERERRRLYAKQYRQRAAAKARDAERAQRRRATADGAALNRERVKADRAKLGRAYLAELLHSETKLPCREIPDSLVILKREQISLRRLAAQMRTAAAATKEPA
jgi:hypothetical protein